MSVYENSHAQIAIAGVADRIGRVILAMVSSIRDLIDTRRTRKMLSRLTNAELDDIGLERSDIDRVSRRQYN